MSNPLKDLGILLFKAGEEFEQKTDEFRKKNKDRYTEFEGKIRDAGETMGNRFDEEVNRARGSINDLTTRIGLASKKEIDELRDKLDELSRKLDTFNENKTSGKDDKKKGETSEQ